MIKFTVLIPTRERCEVLKSALKTCTAQNYDNLQIIVSDNFSQDKTKEIVDSFKDNRIKYINTGNRVSMTDNWEFALSHVNDGYVTYLGDDDGLIPGSLSELNEFIKQTSCEAISCKTAVYFWPDYIEKSKKNTLVISLRSSVVKRNSKKTLNEVINFKRSYEELPSLYRGFVSYNAIKKVIQESGKFFHSMIPDVYSGIALASVLETYYYSFKPYTISGASSHSHGAAYANISNDNQTYKKFFSENNMPFHKKLAIVSSSPIFAAESALQAKDHLSSAKHLEISIKKCVTEAIKEAVYLSENRYKLVIEAVRKIAQINQIEDYTSQLITKYKKLPMRSPDPVLGFNIVYNQIVIDSAEFEAQNVCDAAVICKHILIVKKFNYFSLIGIIKTTFALIKREILNRFNIATNR